MKEETLIMIINWKWRIIATPVNSKNVDGFTDEQINAAISTPGNQYFTIYNANTNYAKKAKVVATNIYEGQKTNQIFTKIVDYLHTIYPNPVIYLLLHRGHNHSHQEIETLLQINEGKVKKIFLFSDGRDFIYYKTYGKGFLDDLGNFWKQDGVNVVEEDKETKKQTLRAPYFDNVWHYYDHEFRKKICELKQDILDVCTYHTFPNRPDSISHREFIDYFKDSCNKQGKHLCLRIKSFLGEYDNIENPKKKSQFKKYDTIKEECEVLEDFEEESKRSYIFDDCNANMEHILPHNEKDKLASDSYKALREKMKPLFSLSAPPSTVTKDDILEVRNLFRNLLDCLDGGEN